MKEVCINFMCTELPPAKQRSWGRELFSALRPLIDTTTTTMSCTQRNNIIICLAS